MLLSLDQDLKMLSSRSMIKLMKKEGWDKEQPCNFVEWIKDPIFLEAVLAMFYLFTIWVSYSLRDNVRVPIQFRKGRESQDPKR